jgi:tetratricopeptide (TPR) repeat protein
MFRVVVCLGIICITAGCAARGARPGMKSAASSLQTQKAGPTDGLEEFMSKVRARSLTARPLTRRELTVEATDVALTAALITVKARPSAANHRKVAAQYLRHGIKDVAHEHFTAALKLDSRDAASWDGLARIWRDWGFPNLALPDATRAVYYAPDSPVVHNTLGTILQVLGRRAEARAQYEKALAVDATAAYALTNLCYGWALEGEAEKAANACGQALRLQPDMEAARNNLAVAYEVSGDSTAALDVLAESADAARTQYNAGILHLAARRYPEALKAFDKALALRPPFAAAELMARQTRRQLQEGTAR